MDWPIMDRYDEVVAIARKVARRFAKRDHFQFDDMVSRCLVHVNRRMIRLGFGIGVGLISTICRWACSEQKAIDSAMTGTIGYARSASRNGKSCLLFVDGDEKSVPDRQRDDHDCDERLLSLVRSSCNEYDRPLLDSILSGEREYDHHAWRMTQRIRAKLNPQQPASDSANDAAGDYLGSNGRWRWTDDIIALMGKIPDGDIATMMGCDRSYVSSKRQMLGIKRFPLTRPSKRDPSVWTEEVISLLGKMSDQEIGRRIGRSAQTVAQFRKQRKISGYRRQAVA